MNNQQIFSALVIFLRMSSWVAFPILAALLLGKYLDNLLNTKYIFLILTGLSFIVSIFGIVKELNSYLKSIDKNNNDPGKNN